MTNFRTKLVKSPENADLFRRQFREEMFGFRIEHENPKAKLFGTQIDLGPTVIQIDRARVEGFHRTVRRFKRAKMGDAVPISLLPLAPVHFLLADRASLFSLRES